jgi:transcriptional regulator with XRE-family HTH domain
MDRKRSTRTKVQRDGRKRGLAEVDSLVRTLQQAREDAGISQRRLALAAGLGPSAVREVEERDHEPTIGVLARLAAALGGELAVRYYPGTGPRIRDHLQTAMLDKLVACLHPRWTSSPEVWVTHPVKGVIDLLLTDLDRNSVVTEAHSELRRLEQQVRWLHAKVDALATPAGPPPSSLLLLRDHPSTRAVAIRYADYLSTAFPARHRDAVEAIVGQARWPGATIVWMTVTKGVATIREEPPRGVTVGR